MDVWLPIPWYLRCPWCDYVIQVNPRGQHGKDPGAGVEAAQMMQRHVETGHDKTWDEFRNQLNLEG